MTSIVSCMTDVRWDEKRDLRIKLLKIVDEVQQLSVDCRSIGLSQDYAIDLNSIQIKLGELIGRLWIEK